MSGAAPRATQLPPSPAEHWTADRLIVSQPLEVAAAISARASATVRLRPQWVWHRLSDPCNWTGLFEHLTLVTKSDLDLDDYTWSALGFTCKVRLTVREPPLHLAWQSNIGAEPQLSGEIILEPLEWYTRLTVRLNYVTDDPQLIRALQPLEAQLQRDVIRIAQMLESPALESPALERPSCEPS